MNEESKVLAVHESEWKGYRRHDFTVAGHAGLLVLPKKAAEGRPWVWRAEFFGAFDRVDMAMLEKGWYLTNYSISDMYGCPEAVELMHGFQRALVTEFSISEKAVIFGFSRGGLYAFNYAAKHPEQVSALYLDAPVLDIFSWPGGFGAAARQEKEWQECLQAYGLTEETVKSFHGSPLDLADRVIDAGIPMIIVAGDADADVPISENTFRLAGLCKAMGDGFKLIIKPGVAHHPHSLGDPSPIVSFLETKRRL